MAKLACTCGFVADEDSEEWVRKRECWYQDERGSAYETNIYCPECGSDDIEEAEECEHCHEWFHPDVLIPADKDCGNGWIEPIQVCSSCYDDYYFKMPVLNQTSISTDGQKGT